MSQTTKFTPENMLYLSLIKLSSLYVISVTEALPSITGYYQTGSRDPASGDYYPNMVAGGVFTKTSLSNGRCVYSTNGSYQRGQLNFSASNSSAIYGRSTHVIPTSRRTLLLIRY